MTTMPHHSNPFSLATRSSLGREEHRGERMKNLAGIGECQISASRKAFAAMLWRAFPSPSENELAQKAARALDVSPRQVKNWLRYENSAAVHYVFAVAAIAGMEFAFKHAG